MEWRILLRRADPGKFGPVELDFRPPYELIEIERRVERAHRQSVRFGNTIKVIGADDPTRSGHVLRDNGWISGDMLSDMPRRQTRPEIVSAAGGRGDDDSDRLTLIEGR